MTACVWRGFCAGVDWSVNVSCALGVKDWEKREDTSVHRSFTQQESWPQKCKFVTIVTECCHPFHALCLLTVSTASCRLCCFNASHLTTHNTHTNAYRQPIFKDFLVRALTDLKHTILDIHYFTICADTCPPRMQVLRPVSCSGPMCLSVCPKLNPWSCFYHVTCVDWVGSKCAVYKCCSDSLTVCISTYTRVPRYSLHLLSAVCFQTLERKKRSLLGQKMPFVKGKGRGWSDDAFSSEDGMSALSTAWFGRW